MPAKTIVESLDLTYMGRSDGGGEFVTEEGEVKEYSEAHLFSYLDDDGNIQTVTYRVSAFDKLDGSFDVRKAKPGDKVSVITEYVLYTNKDGNGWFSALRDAANGAGPKAAS